MVKIVRGIAALLVAVALTCIIPVVSFLLSALYWASVVLPLIRHVQRKPNPCVGFMYLYTAALWHLCYKPILGTRLVVVDINPKDWQEVRSTTDRKVLHMLLGNHPSTPALFPYILHEMRQYPWIHIAVKMSLMVYPYGLPGLLCGCFTFIVRGGSETGRAYSRKALRNRVRRAIETRSLVVLFGDGSRFTLKRRDALRESSKQWLRQRANELHNVLPERHVGMQTILQEAEALGADVHLQMRAVFTRKHGTESLFALWKMVGEPIFIFKMGIQMNAKQTPEQMGALWNLFDEIAKDPEAYALAFAS